MTGIDLFSEFRSSLIMYFKDKGVEINSKSFRLTKNHSLGDIIICSRYFVSEIDEDTMHELKSRAWPLSILDVRWQKYRLSISLNRKNVFEFGFESFGTFKSMDFFDLHQTQTSNFQFNMQTVPDDLTCCRGALLEDVTKNLLYAANLIQITNTFFPTNELIGNKNDKTKRTSCCGKVHCEGNNHQKIDITSKKYLEVIENTVTQKMNDRNGADGEVVSILTDAIFKFEILRVKPQNPVNLKLPTLPADDSFADAVIFIQYNYSRLNAIIHEFESRVSRNVYLPLPPIECTDFSLLKNEKEWTLMINFILQFPDVILKSAEFTSNNNSSPHVLCNYLYSLACNISSYYRGVKILLETKTHLMPLIHARLHLVRVVHKIFHIGFRLLNIREISAL